MRAQARRFAKDESGATAVEYGLLVAGIALAVVNVIGQVSGQLTTLFDSVASELKPH
jgi:pilus assembly protein Flp/PilA